MKSKEKRTHKSSRTPPKDAYDLPNLHTRILLRYLRSCGLPRWFYEDDRNEDAPYGYKPCRDRPVIPYEAIKAELDKREHVMNKLEAEQFRRTMATTHHGSRQTTGVR